MPKKPIAREPVERSKSQIRTDRLIDRLLEAATQFFMEKGFEATSMGEIAKHAQASKETFYRHFPTKEELFQAALHRRAEQIATEFGSVLLSQAPPEIALAKFGQVVLERLLAPEAMAFRRVMMMESVRFPELQKTLHARGPARVNSALAHYLEDQVSKGRLRQMNSTVAARQFFDLVAAEMTMEANVPFAPKPTTGEIKQRVKEAMDCFLHGYGAKD
ncbi:TetR/AcrR family transcriptional regulator [Granulicella aggregans]|jgi:AcrR family transcriptional regulator|uniref:TetR/AcrR family transcriptional regulator n=1 Tax=Granulicella aggregans TaxID=474949 RepID=UPI0021E068EF|nr:TetR/AcrR family transcriptional regulator [Granulicella aggregans]